MEIEIISLLLFTAFLHASWNGVIKLVNIENRKSVSIVVNSLGCFIGFFTILLFFNDIEIPIFSPYQYTDLIVIAFISAFIHAVYWVKLPDMYEKIDMSVCYPISRGLSIILITVISYLLLNDNITAIGFIGIIVITMGILLTVFSNKKINFDIKFLIPSLYVGILISIYTLLDGVGARVSGDAFQYMSALWFFEMCFTIYLLVKMFFKKQILIKNCIKISLLGGLMNLFAYGGVIYVMSMVQFGYVSALREVSSVFAVIIAIFIFKEESGIKRIFSAIVVSLGCILISIGG